MPARIQQKVLCAGKAKQSAIGTASASFLQFSQLNSDIASPSFMTEDNAAEIGKGNEFATQRFPTSYDVGMSINKYGSVEFNTWAWAYGLGNVVIVGSGAPYAYTITPIDPGTSLELPYTTIVEQVAEGGGSAVDAAYLGCAVEEVTTEIKFGAGRGTSMTTVTLKGSGKITLPSGVTPPGVLTENNLLSGSMAATILGTDYAANGNLLSVKMGWKNNLDPGGLGLHPGSGTQALSGGQAAQIRNRLYIGTRVATFELRTLLVHSSPEFAALANLTTGTGVITLTKDSNNNVTWTWQKMGYKSVVNGQESGLVDVTITGAPEYDATNGIVTVTAQCGTSGIAQ
jgi:hypothetical protein